MTGEAIAELEAVLHDAVKAVREQSEEIRGFVETEKAVFSLFHSFWACFEANLEFNDI